MDKTIEIFVIVEGDLNSIEKLDFTHLNFLLGGWTVKLKNWCTSFV